MDISFPIKNPVVSTLCVSVRFIPIDEQGLSRHDKIAQMTAESR